MKGPASEVAQIHVIPLPTSTSPAAAADPRVRRALIQLPLLGHYVHAPTAAVIYQFCQAGLHGTTTRVATSSSPCLPGNSGSPGNSQSPGT